MSFYGNSWNDENRGRQWPQNTRKESSSYNNKYRTPATGSSFYDGLPFGKPKFVNTNSTREEVPVHPVPPWSSQYPNSNNRNCYSISNYCEYQSRYKQSSEGRYDKMYEKRPYESSENIKEPMSTSSNNIQIQFNVPPPPIIHLNAPPPPHIQINVPPPPPQIQEPPKKSTPKPIIQSVKIINEPKADKLPEKLDKNKIIQLVNSTTKFEPAMQKLLRDKRLQSARELRNRYKNNEIENDDLRIDHEHQEALIPSGTLDRFNSLVPDLGVDVDALPPELMEHLNKAIQGTSCFNEELKTEFQLEEKEPKIEPLQPPPMPPFLEQPEFTLGTFDRNLEGDPEPSHLNSFMNALELPSNLDECQLEDVSSFFNFTDINSEKDLNQTQSFNVVPIPPSSSITTENTIETTNLSPIKSNENSHIENSEKNPKISFKIPASNLKLTSAFSESDSNIGSIEQETEENERSDFREVHSKPLESDKQMSQLSMIDTTAFSLLKPMVQIYSISKNSVESSENNWSKTKGNNDKKEKRNKYTGNSIDFPEQHNKRKDRRSSNENVGSNEKRESENSLKNRTNIKTYKRNYENNLIPLTNDEEKPVQKTTEDSSSEKLESITQTEKITTQNEPEKLLKEPAISICIKENRTQHENLSEEKSLKHQLCSFRYNLTNEVQNTSRNLINFRTSNPYIIPNKSQQDISSSSNHLSVGDDKKESSEPTNKTSSIEHLSIASSSIKKPKESLTTDPQTTLDTTKNKKSESKVVEDIFDITDIPRSKNESKTKHTKDVHKTNRVVKQIPLLDTATLSVMKPSSNFNLYSDIGSDQQQNKTNNEELQANSDNFAKIKINIQSVEKENKSHETQCINSNTVADQRNESSNEKEAGNFGESNEMDLNRIDENLESVPDPLKLPEENINTNSNTAQNEKSNEISEFSTETNVDDVSNSEQSPEHNDQLSESEDHSSSSGDDDYSIFKKKKQDNLKKGNSKKQNKSPKKTNKKRKQVTKAGPKSKKMNVSNQSSEDATEFTITEIKSLANINLNKSISKMYNAKPKSKKKITKANKKKGLSKEKKKTMNNTKATEENVGKKKKKNPPKFDTSNENDIEPYEKTENLNENVPKMSKEEILLQLMQIDIKIQSLMNEKSELYNQLRFVDDIKSNSNFNKSLDQLNSVIQSNSSNNQDNSSNENTDSASTPRKNIRKRKKNLFNDNLTPSEDTNLISNESHRTEITDTKLSEKQITVTRNKKRKMIFPDDEEDDIPLSKVKNKANSVRSGSSLSFISTTSNATSYSDLSVIKPCSVSITPLEIRDLSKYNSMEIKNEIIDKSDDFKIEIENFDECASNYQSENNDIESDHKVFSVETEENCGTIISKTIQCIGHQGSVLCVKVVGNCLVAGCEDGKLYKYDINSGKLLAVSDNHKLAITCLLIIQFPTDQSTNIYSGSLDGTFRCFSLADLESKGSKNIDNPIQCMDFSWGYIFIGTSSGHLYRYSIENDKITDDQRQLSEKALLAIKATREGGRRVLLVAPRGQLLSIRDAMTGLLLRYVSTDLFATIYSILLSNSIIYCGTNQNFIASYNFDNGQAIKNYPTGKGVVCLFKHKKLLFAGCYDGYIYVFDLNTNSEIINIPGPGGMILALAIVDNRIIVGCKNSCLEIIDMPDVVKSLNV